MSFSRGGRHVEIGMALALGKRVMVCGPYEKSPSPTPESRASGHEDRSPLHAGDDSREPRRPPRPHRSQRPGGAIHHLETLESGEDI
jgi:hypothetical protein